MSTDAPDAIIACLAAGGRIALVANYSVATRILRSLSARLLSIGGEIRWSRSRGRIDWEGGIIEIVNSPDGARGVEFDTAWAPYSADPETWNAVDDALAKTGGRWL